MSSNDIILELCLRSNLLIRLGDLLSTKDLLRLALVNRALRKSIWTAYFSEPCSPLQESASDPPAVSLPLSYAGVQVNKDGKLTWLRHNPRTLAESQDGIALRHVVLDEAFNQLPKSLRLQLISNLNHVTTLQVNQSFFACSCEICCGEVPGERESARLPPFMTSSTPAVYAGLHTEVDNEYSSNSSSSDIAADETEEPAVYSVNAVSETGRAQQQQTGQAEPSRDEETSLKTRRILMRHAFDQLILAFQIAYRNRGSLRRLNIVGPPPLASTALLKDEELFKLPFPMKPRPNSSAHSAPALQTQVMHSFFSQDTQTQTDHSKSQPQEHTVRFTLLEQAEFGTTVDCRYIVPFLDYSIFDKLTSVTIGRSVLHTRLPYHESEPLYACVCLSSCDDELCMHVCVCE